MVGDTYADLGTASRGAGLFIGISNIYPDCPEALKSVEYLPLLDLTGLPAIMADVTAQPTKAFSTTK